MLCPACGMYHPPLYENCLSCGARLDTAGHGQAPASGAGKGAPVEGQADLARIEPGHHLARKSRAIKQEHFSRIPVFTGILVSLIILLVCFGATIFFLTKPSNYQRFLQQGQRQLANGQYAFAVSSLEQACALNKKDPQVYLALARAYVGVDQIDKAWECISEAQQLGQAIASQPTLASDLANYYRQRKKWSRAADLLRPLAQAGLPGKAAELCDLDGLWGDECLATGNLDQALKCWEEIRAVGQGTRTSEVDARLATIYERYADNLLAAGDDAKALDYLSRLNSLVPTAATFEKLSEIYERNGQLDLAIEELRKEAKLEVKDPFLNKRLAALLNLRGKEFLDKGDAQTGLAYLQEAGNFDPRSVVPKVALKNVTVQIRPATGAPELSGQIWNPGTNPLLFLSLKVELYDRKANKIVWSREQTLIDEFTAPLPAKEEKPFSIGAPYAVKENGELEFRVYLGGQLYKSYALRETASKEAATQVERPPLAPPAVPDSTPALPAPPERAAPARIVPAPQQIPDTSGAEDKTLKDLEF